MAELLEEGLAALGMLPGEAALSGGPGPAAPEKTPPLLQILERYIEEIELFNPAYGLVKVRDRRELVVKHILDSLAPVHVLRRLLDKKPGAAVDVGSGAGLPGIPLAACMTGTDFTLIERMGRRAGFLRNTLAVLGLPNVRIAETEMEKFTPRSCFDIAVFRAFRPLDGAVLKGLLRLLAPGGILAAYKGRREAVLDEMNRAPSGLVRGWELIPLDVPFLDEERNLLVIRAPVPRE